MTAGDDPEPAATATGSSPPAAAAKNRRRRPGQVLLCGWCAGQITLRATGRTPTWCSDTCRHRAWETSRAAASGAAAVRVVDRTIEVQVPVIVVEHVEVPTTPKGPGWVPALHELAAQIDTGKIYDRDLTALAGGVDALITALNRRHGPRRPH